MTDPQAAQQPGSPLPWWKRWWKAIAAALVVIGGGLAAFLEIRRRGEVAGYQKAQRAQRTAGQIVQDHLAKADAATDAQRDQQAAAAAEADGQRRAGRSALTASREEAAAEAARIARERRRR